MTAPTAGGVPLPVRGRDPVSGRFRMALRHPGARTACFVVVAVIAATVLWFRLPPLAHDTLWAEDGRLFLAGAEQHGPFGASFVPYAGYLQFLPRLIAGAVVAGLPAAWWAYGITAGACLVTGLVACVVYVASRDVISSPGVRCVLAAVIILVPLGPRDVLGNAANLHSVLFWMCFWLLLVVPRTRGSAIGMSVLGFAAAASEIQTVFLIPQLILAARRRFGWLLGVGPGLGIAAQLVTTVLAPRAQATATQDSPASIAMGYLINAVLPNLAPQDQIGSMITHGGVLLAVITLLLLIALVGLSWRASAGSQRVAVLAAAGCSTVVWTVSVVDNPARFYNYAAMTPAQLEHVWLTRYGVVPAMLLISIALIATDVLLRGNPRRSVPFAVAAVTLALVGVCLFGNYLPTYTRRSAGPSWSAQIPAAQYACRTQPDRSRIVLNETLGWKVPVSCTYLDPCR